MILRSDFSVLAEGPGGVCVCVCVCVRGRGVEMGRDEENISILQFVVFKQQWKSQRTIYKVSIPSRFVSLHKNQECTNTEPRQKKPHCVKLLWTTILAAHARDFLPSSLSPPQNLSPFPLPVLVLECLIPSSIPPKKDHKIHSRKEVGWRKQKMSHSEGRESTRRRIKRGPSDPFSFPLSIPILGLPHMM